MGDSARPSYHGRTLEMGCTMIEIVKTMDLNKFEFWGSAKVLRSELSNYEMNVIEDNLDDIIVSIPEDLIGSGRCFEPYDETLINDVFAYCQDYVVKVLGFEDYEEFLEEHVK